MDDLRERLHRLTDRVTDERDAYERLGAARRRRDRRRRIGAGGLALVIAVGGTFAAVSAIKGGSDTNATAAGYELPAVPYLWPENWARSDGATPQDIQAKVDAGEDGVQWRTDPEEVARQFAKNVIGRPDVILSRVSDVPAVPGVVFLLEPCGKCVYVSQFQQYVWLRQPVREGTGGIWDVAGAWADTLDVGIGHRLADRIDTLSGSGTLHMELKYLDDQTVTVGFVAQNGCSRTSRIAQQGASGPTGSGPYDLALLDIADPDHPIPSPVSVTLSDAEGCGTEAAGYAFAYTVPSLTVPTGDPFLEVGAIDAVTAMPLAIDLGPAASPSPKPTSEEADHVVISCGDTGAAIYGPTNVIAQRDGVHVTLDNATSEQMSVSFDQAGSGDGGGPGLTDLVVDSPPGAETASCQTTSRTIGSVSFMVVDPHGYYESPTLDCGAGVSGSGSSGGGDSVPEEQLPSVATTFLAKLVGQTAATVHVVRAGYPADPSFRTFVLDQAGTHTHSVIYIRDSGGWVWSSHSACSG